MFKHALIGTGATVVAVLVAVTPAFAQHGGAAPMQHPAAASPHAASPGKPATPPAHSTFNGIAAKLNMTPDAMAAAFQTAQQANPKLTHGQFIAANVLAQNLGSKNPAITTQAILDGLKGGSSIGQTLQHLGLSSGDADKAQDAANREIREAAHAKPPSQPDSTKS